MCGRFVSSSSPEAIQEYFGATFAGESLGANFNVAPTNDVYAVVGELDGGRELEAFRWGLVPSWAKDVKIGSKMINARGETLGTKPAFKSAFRKHRCVVPMDGFYEWKVTDEVGPSGKPQKQPMYITRADGGLLAVAGLTAAWRDPELGRDHDGDWLHSVAVVTTSANATMQPVHDRMPVILPEAVWDEWLDPNMHDLERLATLLVPASNDVLVMHPVSTDVNSVRNKGAELIERTTV